MRWKNFHLACYFRQMQKNRPINFATSHRYPIFPVNLVSRGTFHFKSFPVNETPIGFADKRPVKFYFASYRIGRSVHSAYANRYRSWWHRARGVARFPNPRRHPLPRAFERKRNSGGGWHVSRLSVFTEIPCTLRPITFVTDYSTKVSRRARAQAETYPDKLHRANRQCSQMEPEARRLFKQEASRSCGFHDRTREDLSTPVISRISRFSRWV